MWTDRLPARYLDRGPRIVRQRMGRSPEALGFVPDEAGQWCDVWHYDDLVSPLMMLSAAVGCGSRPRVMDFWPTFSAASWP